MFYSSYMYHTTPLKFKTGITIYSLLVRSQKYNVQVECLLKETEDVF